MAREPVAATSDEVVVRPPTRADLPAIRELFTAVKGRQRPPAYEEWHLFDGPLGPSPSLAAFLGGSCIGLYVMLPALLRLGHERVPGVQVMDVMTHPEHRRQGVFAQLARDTVLLAEEQGFEVAYGFPNDTSFPLFIRYRNAQHVGDVVSYATYPTSGRWWRRSVREPALGSLDLDEARPAGDELDRLVERLHDEAEVCRVDKGSAYLEWRYAPPSGDSYEWLTLRDRSGAAVAVAVVGDRHGDGMGSQPVARIQELFAGTVEHATLLVRLATARAAARGVGKVQMLVKEPVVEAALPRTALRPESTVHFCLRKLTTRIQGGNVHHFPYWRLVSGDMDVY